MLSKILPNQLPPPPSKTHTHTHKKTCIHSIYQTLQLVFKYFFQKSTAPSRAIKRYFTEMADEGKLEKMEVDYSSTVDEKIPECEKLAKVTPASVV